jgi:uncharacterized protein
MPTGMRFEWDPEKARRNQAKHGVSFEEGMSAFDDPLSLTVFDPDHSFEEDRFLLLGASRDGRLVVIAHAFREDAVRIISVRMATSSERRDYASD